MVRPCKAGDTGSKIAGSCSRESRRVEAWAGINRSQQVPTFVGCGSPLSGSA